ncbi:molecular chaperone [Luteimonas aestuarii]|uniref:Molecular chaperone n=1 Tax=Luteimonas aestuarii TaxID=453837 RepID=A0A4R5TXY4_9GAMM|nr:molecular chaperone [Luteimonas aestuarii]TDK26079.1 molecular chaperone [Luteimonas aestuarii]
MSRSTHEARWRRSLCCAAALLLAAAAAGAASLQVTPTTVTVPAERAADGLILSNSGSAPLHAQVRVFRWTQVDGEDVLEPSTDLAISPPMLELAPGGDQLVRIVRLGPPPTGTEASYRVIVDELPLDDTPAPGRRGLQFVLRYSIPVFLAPHGNPATAPILHARIGGDADDRFLQLDNLGNGHAQVADLTHVAADGHGRVIAQGLSGYVLPGQTRRWSLPAGLDATPGGSFQARINGEAVERTLVLDR